MPDKAPLEQDSDQYEQDRKDYDELQGEKDRYLDNQQRRVKRVLADREDRGNRVHGSFAPFILAKSREDAEALTGRRALVARFTDLTRFIGDPDTEEMFEIHQELVGGFRQVQMPISQSSKGSLKLNDVREAISLLLPTTLPPLVAVQRWFWDPALLTWNQIVGVPVPPVGEIARIEVIQTGALMGAFASIYIGERGYVNTLIGVQGLIADLDNQIFFAGPFAIAVAGISYDRLTPPDIVYINHDDEPSLIAGNIPNNTGFKNGVLYVLISVTGIAPPPVGIGPTTTLRVKITTKEAI
jgi:hypothetical protein